MKTGNLKSFTGAWLVLLTALVLGLPASVAAQNIYPIQSIGRIVTAPASGSLDAAEDAVTLDLRGFPGAAVQVTGAWEGTLTFEVSVDGTTYQALNMVATDATSLVSTTTGNGLWQGSPVGARYMRVRASEYSSGTAVVTIQATLGGGAGSSGGGGGGGEGGAVTTDADDASIATGQTNDNANSLMMAFDGSVWRRLTFGIAGSASAQVLTVQGVASMTPLEVNCASGCSAGTSDDDDGSIATAQSVGLFGGLSMAYDGSVWRRLTFGIAGSASAQVFTVQGVASMTPLSVTFPSAQAVMQSGTWTVQPGNTANTTPWLFTLDPADEAAIDLAAIRTATENTEEAITTLVGTLSADVSQGDNVIPSAPHLMLEAVDIDGAALPNLVTEGKATRAKGTLAGAALVHVVNEDGTGAGAVAQSGSWSVGQSGTWTVQPGNTANTTPWLVRLAEDKHACADISQTQSVPISTSTSGNVQLVALSGSTVIYVCGFDVTSQADVSVQFISGTGTACATGETDRTGTYPLVAASGQGIRGIARPNGGAVQFKGAAGEAVCIELSGAVQVDGLLTYVQR